MRNVFSTSKGKQIRIDPQRILYMTGDANYCYIHLLDGQVLLMARTLKWYAQQWPQFLRVHKQALVNPNYATQLLLAPNLRLPSYLVMSNQEQIPISRRRLSLVRHRLSTMSCSVIKLVELETAELG